MSQDFIKNQQNSIWKQQENGNGNGNGNGKENEIKQQEKNVSLKTTPKKQLNSIKLESIENDSNPINKRTNNESKANSNLKTKANPPPLQFQFSARNDNDILFIHDSFEFGDGVDSPRHTIFVPPTPKVDDLVEKEKMKFVGVTTQTSKKTEEMTKQLGNLSLEETKEQEKAQENQVQNEQINHDHSYQTEPNMNHNVNHNLPQPIYATFPTNVPKSDEQLSSHYPFFPNQENQYPQMSSNPYDSMTFSMVSQNSIPFPHQNNNTNTNTSTFHVPVSEKGPVLTFPLVSVDLFSENLTPIFIPEFIELCKSQFSCRFLQNKIETNSQEFINGLIFLIQNNFIELMVNQFGNYLCQKIFEFCTQEQRTFIISKIAVSIPKVSLNIYGTRAVQKLIDSVTTEDQKKAVLAQIERNTIELINNSNGNHVIQRCLQKFSSAENDKIFSSIINNCVQIATDKYGCCVLQRCFDFASNEQRDGLYEKVRENAILLVEDQYANYVVQHILESPNFADSFIPKIIPHFVDLSVQKFSSNVVEKCLKVANNTIKQKLIEQLVSKQENVLKLLHDPYANYVIQTTINVANQEQQIYIAERIKPNLSSIQNPSFRNRLTKRVLQILGNSD
ncbi:hypothetical protein M0811_14432 [Anaeramoeba ignava]|uniref:PUM-HD domain-containing protein n=1 Tax=Anaeramoeba ignava TaxID=1746090 RepID=A0A9Q0LV07_ANAIG|nr:hypothetical protein M0811_14432 [Anaeramoeba ignava]